MYFRKKTSGGRAYLQIVESRREGAQVRQQVIATLGRVEDLRESGQLERLLRSGARFAAKAIVVDALNDGTAISAEVRRIGPALVFERLWDETGCRTVIEQLAGERKHGFALERAVFLTVLHRLFAGGSDRAADRWREDYRINGVEGLDLHHLYRAMAWLGEDLPASEQDDRTPFAPRCLKDVVEERLFEKRRDLFSKLDLVFMDTTSLYFEGAGGQTLGRHGYSKDHRPDLRQMILAVLLDGDGRPVCTEMWPGNTADTGSLVPVVDRLRQRFSISRVCIVADRGMISAETIAELEARQERQLRGEGGGARRAALHRLPQSRGSQERCRRPRRDSRRAGAATQEGRQGAGRQWRLSPFPGDHWRERLRHRSRQGRGGRQVRRRLRAAHQHRPRPARCHALLQAADHGGAGVPHGEKPFRNASDLPQARRDNPRSRVVQLPRPCAEEGTGGPHRRPRQAGLVARDPG